MRTILQDQKDTKTTELKNFLDERQTVNRKQQEKQKFLHNHMIYIPIRAPSRARPGQKY